MSGVQGDKKTVLKWLLAFQVKSPGQAGAFFRGRKGEGRGVSQPRARPRNIFPQGWKKITNFLAKLWCPGIIFAALKSIN
jgi:hypothetical protein